MTNNKEGKHKKIKNNCYIDNKGPYGLDKLISRHTIVSYIGGMLTGSSLEPGKIKILMAGDNSILNALQISAILNGLGLNHSNNEIIIAYNNHKELEVEKSKLEKKMSARLKTYHEEVVMNLQETSFEKESISVIFLNNALDFCLDDKCFKKVLIEMCRILKSNGKIFIQLLHGSYNDNLEKCNKNQGIDMSVEYFKKMVDSANLNLKILSEEGIQSEVLVTVSVLTKK